MRQRKKKNDVLEIEKKHDVLETKKYHLTSVKGKKRNFAQISLGQAKERTH